MGRMRLNVMMSRRRQVIGAGTGSAGTQSLSGRDRSRKHRYHDRSGWMLEPQCVSVSACTCVCVCVCACVPVCICVQANTHTQQARAHTHTHTHTSTHTSNWCHQVCRDHLVCLWECVCVCVCVYVCAVRVDGDSGCRSYAVYLQSYGIHYAKCTRFPVREANFLQFSPKYEGAPSY